MSSKNSSQEDDTAFMDDLLAGIDASFFDGDPSSPDPPAKSSSYNPQHANLLRTPTKPRHARTLPNSPYGRKSSPCKHRPVESQENLKDLLDGAEEWDWDDDMASDVGTPKKEVKFVKGPTRTTDAAKVNAARCVVLNVSESTVHGHYQKTLIVQTVPNNERKCVILQDNWYDTGVKAGDIVNILGSFSYPATTSSRSPLPTIFISSKANLLIHHPDILITATALSNAPQCRRKPLLSNLVRSSSDVSPALIWGNILHEVMQTCLSEGRWEEEWIDQKIHNSVSRSLGELLRVNIGVDQAKREVKARAKGLQPFAQKYMSDRPKDEAIVTNTRAKDGQASILAITNLYDVEEDIWSPTYGMKGKLDASVHAIFTEKGGDNPFAKALTAGTTTSYPVPLEIKTGRAVAGMEHRAQTMLYTLLMGERYKTEVPSGLLFYTQSDEVVRVPAVRNEIRALLMARNDVAGYMMRRIKTKSSKPKDSSSEAKAPPPDEPAVEEPFLPPTLDDGRLCGRCFVADVCMLYRRAVEDVKDSGSEIVDMYNLKTSHLTPAQCEFFKKWEALISLEEQDLIRFRKELWTMGAKEREEKGRCFSSMVMDDSFQVPSNTLKAALKKDGSISRFTYRFKKADTGGSSLLNGHMSTGDAVTISVEPDLLAFSRGFITELTPQQVVVVVDHVVDLDKIRGRQQLDSIARVLFRLDKDELSGGMGRIRDNLAQLFYVDGDTKRLELVVDLRPPVFQQWQGPIVPAHERVAQTVARLNHNQQEAMRKVLSAEDYALILGMPGTGKTTVIAAIISALVCIGKSVLLTSYTHSAVDNILLKLKDDADYGILRLGNLDKIHPDVYEFTLSTRKQARSLEELEQQVMGPPVVATTCLSIDHPLFSQRKFDYCIVDEASQVTLPTCLGPLRYADKFILVGDHFQLPPLVRNPDARKGGLEVSLFRRLSEAHPAAVIDLTDQYRMNEDIMLLSNKLIYGDRLRCGSPDVAKRALSIPQRSFLNVLHTKSVCQRESCWLEHLLKESCKAVFVDTDKVPALDSRVGDLVQNVTEARLVYQVTECLIRCGIDEKEIGVISLYRQQNKLLSYLLQKRTGVEILTADRSQGRDKDCIIISMVRSNGLGQLGDLVRDWRRMNVSFTRARSKLIIFGSRSTLKAAPLLEDFFRLMEERNWIYALPPGADNVHELFSRTYPKRAAEDCPDLFSSQEPRPAKKVRTPGVSEESIGKGRHILKDLFNGCK